jgi:predicted dehydrogenase
MKKVRYAVVGTGYISQDAFMPTVDGTGNSCMTTIISGNPEGAKKLTDFYGIAHVYDYSEYDAALASGNFDAVYVALPNSMHAEYTIRAARHGIHALVEKPLAISAQECREMIEAARENKTALMTAYRLHCVPGMIEPIKLVQQGAIGDVKYITSALSVEIPKDNHRWQAKHWGGPLQDLGVYCLNAARNIFGEEPLEAIAMSEDSSNDPAREIDETISVILSFSKGRIASFTSSFSSADMDVLRIVGSEGEIEITPASEPSHPYQQILQKMGKLQK